MTDPKAGLERRLTSDWSSADVSLVTVSYRGDLELAKELCASIDRFAEPGIEHILLVPDADISRFAPLVVGNRRLVSVEDVLPPGYSRIPLPQRIGIGPFFQRRVREVWRAPAGIVRGWIIQQILKLSAPLLTDRSIIAFADSDIVLVRELEAHHFVAEGCVRLFRVPGATEDSEMHRRWHAASARLLGLPPRAYFGADYIGNLITWRRDIVLELQRHLEGAGNERWDKIIAHQRAFSEYVLYGIFVEQVCGLNESGHRATSEDLVHAGWHYELDTPEGLQEFVSGLRKHHVGVAIQSTEDFSVDLRRELIGRILAEA